MKIERETASHDPKQTTDSVDVDMDTIEPEAVAGVIVKTEPQEIQSLLGDIPFSEEPTSTDPTKVTFPLGVVPSGAAVPAGARRAGSISLASLNRPNRPPIGLKLDLSSASLRSLPSLDGSAVLDGTQVDVGTQGGAGTSFDARVASPVTLAPKSAHPRAGDELFDMAQLDLLAAVQAQAEQDQMAINEINDLAAAAEIAVIVGDGTAENPMEIDLDLFGEGAGAGMDLGLHTNSGVNNNETTLASAVDSLFSAGPDNSDPLFSPTEGVVGGAPGIKKENTDGSIGTTDPTTASDLLAALGISSASVDGSVQPPHNGELATASGNKEGTKPADALLPVASSDGLNALDFDPSKALEVPSTSEIQQPLTTTGGLVSMLPNSGATPNDETRQLALQRQQWLARAYNASNFGAGSTPGFNIGINLNARNQQLTPGLGSFTGMGAAAGGIGGANTQYNSRMMLRRQQLELLRRQQVPQQVLVPGQQQHHILPGGMLGTASAGLGPGGLGGVSGSGDPGAGAIRNFGMNFGIGGAGGVGSNPAAPAPAPLGGFSSMDPFSSLDNLLGTGTTGGSFAVPGQLDQKNRQQ